MDWSPQQQQALDAFGKWRAAGYPRQIFRLFGYAGTGKTTLVKHIASTLNKSVCFAAFTGKAALVMRHHGCTGATTIHQLIYKSVEQSDQKYRELQEARASYWLAYMALAANPAAETSDKSDALAAVEALDVELELMRKDLATPRFALNDVSRIQDAELVIIDECSMVGAEIGRDLCSFGVPILVIGDPGQLPPIADTGFFTNHQPDAMLEEIHRQAKDSPIIELASQLRQGRYPGFGKYGESDVHPLSEFSTPRAAGVDQLLVGRNATRKKLNQQLRLHRGLAPEGPVKGDKVVCLRNNHTLGLLNGARYSIQNARASSLGSEKVWLTLDSADVGNETAGKEVLVWTHHFQDREDQLDPRAHKLADYFDYSYALTCHKSQGSQYDSVAILDESHQFGEDRWRWLYTAVTRAESAVTLYTDKLPLSSR